jgi:SSS family solute:Na+ symporter
LAQGQKGIVFAAFMKLLIPFVIVIPGLIAFNLFSGEMRLEARADTARGLAHYLKANPATKLVETASAPTEAQIAAWPAGRYLIALYPDEQTLNGLKTRTPFVLPMTQEQFNETAVARFTTFTTEDRSWKHVNSALADEIEHHNRQASAAAQAAGETPAVEKLIAYKYDTALAQLLGHVLPQGVGLVGFVFAALLGAVVSSLAAMLNAASTIFAMDIYKKHLAKNAGQQSVVLLGRASVVVFTALAVFLAPQLGNPKISNSIFTIIQEGQGFISSGILAAFVFGLLVRRAPPVCGVVALLTNVVAYGLLKVGMPSLQFLNRMAVCLGLCLAVMALITWLKPLATPIEFRQNTAIALESSKHAQIAGWIVVIVTLLLYVLFSPLGVAK